MIDYNSQDDGAGDDTGDGADADNNGEETTACKILDYAYINPYKGCYNVGFCETICETSSHRT